MPKRPALAIVIGSGGKPGRMGRGLEKDDEGEDYNDEDDPLAVSKEEVEALETFDAATDPKERAQALKAFIKLCMEEGY
jgi:hypothetical protein